MDQTITITFGECVENGVGMERIGKRADTGFGLKDLRRAKEWFLEHGARKCTIINLKKMLEEEHVELLDATDQPYVLIVRGGVKALGIDPDALLEEQSSLVPDTKKWNRGRVTNCIARYNLCYADFTQEPDYENKMGRIYDFEDLTLLKKVRGKLPKAIGPKARVDKKTGLYAEGNFYYNEECGIGYHCDFERNRVVAIRLGKSMPIHFQWYLNYVSIGENKKFVLNHGDIYIMSKKALGSDGRRKTIPIVKHSAGAKKYTHPKK